MIVSLIKLMINRSINPFLYEYYPLFRLKVFDSYSGPNPRSTNLIHSKIFLIDNEILFLGSANFTYSAFQTHYETVIKINDTQAIKDIDDEVEALFKSTELKARDIQEWGGRFMGVSLISTS